jgi:hypothetical protein
MKEQPSHGEAVFIAWTKQTVSPNGEIWWNRWLGEFNPNLSAKEANIRLDHVGKLQISAQKEFKQGWTKAQKQFLQRGIEDVEGN